MKAKEVILGKLWVDLNNRESDPEMHLYLSPDQIDMVYEAMGEFAKQEAIEFVEWVNTHENCYYFLYANEDDPDDASVIWRNRNDKSECTSEQLYQLYLQSKQPK